MVLTRFIPSISRFLALDLRTIISIVLFMFKNKLSFLAHLDMWSISSKIADELTDGIIR